MDIALTIVFIILGLAFAVSAGVFLDEVDSAVLLLIPAAMFLLIAVGIPTNDANVRWKEWSVCEDNVTQVDSVIIADCDEYYKYPGEPNEKE